MSITPDVTVHGDGFAEPFSKPGLPSICWVPDMIVNLTFIDLVCPPPEPLTIILYVPAGVNGSTVMLIVVDPDPGAAIEAGLKLTDVPAGNPVADIATDELKFPSRVDVIVVDAELPCRMLSDDWAPESENVGPKTMSTIGCSSIAFGAIPSCPSL